VDQRFQTIEERELRFLHSFPGVIEGEKLRAIDFGKALHFA